MIEMDRIEKESDALLPKDSDNNADNIGESKSDQNLDDIINQHASASSLSNNNNNANAKVSNVAPEDEYNITYIVLLFLGVALLLTYNSFVAAPDYTSHYYQYAAQNEHLNSTMPHVWHQISPFITASNMVPNLFAQIAMLSNFVQRIPVLKRLYFAIILNAVAMLMVPITPAFKVEEKTALTVLLLGDAVCGGATALLQSSAFALAAQFPVVQMQATMLGIGVSGTLVSVLQITTYAGFGSDFSAVLKQSSVFFGIGVLALILLCIILPFWKKNIFARFYVVEWKKEDAKLARLARREKRKNRASFRNERASSFRQGTSAFDDQTPAASPAVLGASSSSSASKNKTPDFSLVPPMTPSEYGETENSYAASPASPGLPISPLKASTAEEIYNEDGNIATGVGVVHVDEEEQQRRMSAAHHHDGENDHHSDDDHDHDHEHDVDVWRVLGLCKWNMFANFFVYFVTLMIFPGLGVAVSPKDNWYGIVIIFLFNFGDFSGRMLCRFERFHVRPTKMHYLQIAAACRCVFIPLFILSVKPQVIDVKALPMIFMYLVGITNGFTSSQLMMFTPAMEELHHSERPVAGSAMSLSLLGGCAGGSLTALLISQTYLE